MADSFNKKEREKKRRKRKQDKADQKLQKKMSGVKSEEFMYLDENGNLTPNPPDKSRKKEIKLESIRVSTPKNSELAAVDKQRTGTVKFFNVEKRFGFIEDTMTGEDFFVHEENTLEKISERDQVEFEIGNGPKGPVAIQVKLAKKGGGSTAKKETT